MKIIVNICWLSLIILSPGFPQNFAQEIKYENNFDKVEPGPPPDDFLVLDGQFEVKQEGNNKFLELPGAPLDTFGVLFGPTLKENSSVTARFYGTAKGRRFPTFAVGLNGVGGYKLRVSPGKKQLEIYRAEEVKQSIPYEWQPGKWTYLKISMRKATEKEWLVEGKIWSEGEQEPKESLITFNDIEAPPRGRALVSASPFSGTPVRFDDFLVISR